MIGAFHIEVTQEDIDKGQRGQCQFCPLAVAAQRVIGDARVRVGFSTIFLDVEASNAVSNLRYAGKMPPEARAAIVNFDMQGRMSPFSFDIEMRPYPVVAEKADAKLGRFNGPRC